MKYKILFFVCTIFFCTEVYGQKIGYPEPTVPSSEVVKLTQFNMSQPNLYTGAGSFSIPIYSLNFEGKSISFAMNYQGGGIRAGENSGILGLGWSLGIPGSISRNIQGFDDLSMSSSSGRDFLGYVYDLTPVPDKLVNPTAIGFNDPYWSYLEGGKKDAEPDIFNYSLLGSSGKFILKKKSSSGSPIEVIKLEKNSDQIQFDESTKVITITTPDGFKGEFSIMEFSTSISGTSLNSTFTYSAGSADILQIVNSGGRAASAWHLTKITSPKGRIVTFNYKVNASTKLSDYFTLGAISWGEERSVNSQLVSTSGDSKSWTRVMNESVYLESITALDYDLKIEFTYGNRTDLQKPNSSDVTVNSWLNRIKTDRGNNLGTILDPLRLTKVRILNNSGSNLFNLSADFYQSYFNDAATDKLNFTRLRLDSVKIGEEVHKFKYHNITHSKSTPGFDYWGFYNGRDSNTEIVPVVEANPPTGGYFLINSLFDNYYFQTPNRAADFTYGKAGLLYEVEFPTKGRVIYQHEAHTYKLEGKEVVQTSQPAIPLSGLGAPEISGTGVGERTTTFEYSGYQAGVCGQVEITLRVMCYDFYKGNQCSVDPDDYLINAVEIIGPTGNVLQELKFQYLWALDTNFHSVTYNYIFPPYGPELPAGTYTIKVRSILEDGQTKYYGDAYVNITGNCSGGALVPIVRNQIAGGARVKSISTYDKNSSFIGKKNYLYEDPTFGGEFSSGRLMNPLMHMSQVGPTLTAQGDLITPSIGDPIHFVHTSGSALSNGQAAQGSHIGYSVVQEIEVDSLGNTNGMTMSNFENHTYEFEPMNTSNNFGVSRKVLEDLNGFKNANSVFTSGNSIVTYQNQLPNYIEAEDINALKLFYYSASKPLVSFYKIPTGLVVTKSSEQYLDGVNTKNTFEYNSLNQLSSKKTFDGAQLLEEEKIKYPTDYSSSNSTIAALISSNLIGIPLETTLYRNGALVSSNGTSYSVVGTRILPYKSFVQNRSASFTPTANGVDFLGGYELESTASSYDAYGNPNEIKEKTNQSTALIWDWNGTSVTAVAKNCLISELSYTSFETSNKGGWTYTGTTSGTVMTGKKAYNLGSGSVSKTGISASAAAPYKVGFWARTTTGTGTVNVGGQTEALTSTWKWVEKTITSTSLTISGSSIIIDELRLHPIDAVVTSYTYAPLLGVLSQTDQRGNTLSYFYDTANRLMTIKDEIGNILEHFEYNYAK